MITKAGNAGQLLDAVPEEGRGDPGYMFSRIQWLRRNERIPHYPMVSPMLPGQGTLIS